MLNRIHQKLGTASFVISIVALVAALGGGAYAASGGLSGKQKKEVEKIAKKYAGKPGTTGVTGPVGAAGPAGPAGAKGDAGAAGADGKEGRPGKEGKQGPPGTTGFTEVLPPEATETGTYQVISETGEGTFAVFSITNISFPIPLPAPIAEDHVKYVAAPATTVPPECENGNHVGAAGVQNPEAQPGFICFFNAQTEGMEEFEVLRPGFTNSGVSVAGAVVARVPTEAQAFSEGTWAVTAPEE